MSGYNASGNRNEITWKGNEFEIEASDGSFTCSGQISDDGTDLVFLDVRNSWEIGLVGSSSYLIKNLPLVKSTGLEGLPDSPKVTNSNGYYSFEYNISGIEVESYVASQSHHRENSDGTVASNFESWDPERSDRHIIQIKFYYSR